MAESTPSSLSKDPLTDTPVAQMQDLLDRQKQSYLAEGLVSAATRNDRLERAANLPRAPGDRCLLYTSPSPRDRTRTRMPSSA